MTLDAQAALRERETLVWTSIQALARTASEERRGFTDDEQRHFDELHGELDRISRQHKEAARVSEYWAGQRPPGARGTYVRNASASCQGQGCQSVELAAMLGTTLGRTRELIQSLEGKEKMTPIEPTKALWCEQGGHPFSEKDPDVQVLTISGKDKEGKPVTESRTICGACAAQTKTRLGDVHSNQVTQLPPPAEFRGARGE